MVPEQPHPYQPTPFSNPSASIGPGSPPSKGGMDESNNPIGAVDIGDLLSEPEVPVPYIVPGYLARGSLSLLAGPPKLGKSTLAYDWVVAVATGGPCFGEQVDHAKVLVLALEEHRRDVTARLRQYSEKDLAGSIKIVTGPLPFHDVMNRALASYIAQENIGLVVVDTMPTWWQLQDENDAAEVIRKGYPLLNLVRASHAAWLCIAHSRKSGGEQGQEIRGSSALVGLVDIAISMKRTEAGGRRRVLEAMSRYTETPPQLYIELTEQGYRALGDSQAISIEGKADQVWHTLSGPALTADELSKTTGLSKQDISRALQHLGPRVIHEGSGRKGDPYRYGRNSICPSPPSKGGSVDESNLEGPSNA